MGGVVMTHTRKTLCLAHPCDGLPEGGYRPPFSVDPQGFENARLDKLGVERFLHDATKCT